MNDEAAFVRAIRARPDDDSIRLVFADWLEEQGQSGRAEFIRVQCLLARMLQTVRETPEPGAWPQNLDPDDPFTGHWLELKRRERECWPVDWGRGLEVRGLSGLDVHWSRGFIEAITCGFDAWLRFGHDLLARQPVREATLTECPGDEHEAVLLPFAQQLRRLEVRRRDGTRAVWFHGRDGRLVLTGIDGVRTIPLPQGRAGATPRSFSAWSWASSPP